MRPLFKIFHEPQPSYLHVAIPNFVMVMLQNDMAAPLLSKFRHILEFTLFNQFLEQFATQFVFDYFFIIEPVFDVIAIDQYSNRIEFADWRQMFLGFFHQDVCRHRAPASLDPCTRIHQNLR